MAGNAQPENLGASAEDAITVPLTFIVPQDTKPYFESAALTGTVPKVHFATQNCDVAVNNMRAVQNELDLDRTGFELHYSPTRVDDLYDDGRVNTVYRDELVALLKTRMNADDVAVFDFTRRSDTDAGAPNPDGYRGPANRVHVDYTVDSGPIRARDALGAERYDATLAGGGRVVQVNVWRPIRGPVERTPLALADAKSIAPDNLVATDQRFPDRTGEIYNVSPAPGQRWYWAPKMDRDEVILIKGWDSLDDGRARFTPHGAFELPGQSNALAPRESIEVRTYVLFNTWPR
jgi:hypothetical protein